MIVVWKTDCNMLLTSKHQIFSFPIEVVYFQGLCMTDYNQTCLELIKQQLISILLPQIAQAQFNLKMEQIDFYSMNKRGKAVSMEDTILYDRITRTETKILHKISQIKKEKPNYCCKHFENLKDNCDFYDPNINYYEKYWKLFLLNELCYAKLQDSNAVLNKLEEKVADVQTLFEEHQELLQGRVVKRNRRYAFQVEKKHNCPYPNCFKNYATEVSLNLHIKLKHNGGNKTERQRAAQMIWQARENNQPIPNFYINLPPGFLEEYRQSQSRKSSSHMNSFQEQDISLSRQRQQERK